MRVLRRVLASVLPPTVAFVALNALWEVGVALLAIPAYLLPPPSAIVLATVTHARPLLRAVLLTAQAASMGLVLSGILGVTIGVVIASSRAAHRALYPFTVFLQTVPLVAVAPLLVVWFGYGIRPVAVGAFVVSVFPVIVSTVTGVRSTDPGLLDMFRLCRATAFSRLWKLRLPSALPSIFAGLRIAAGLAVIGAVAGEFVASFAGEDAGIGMLALTFARESQTDRLFAAVGLASLLGLALFGLVSAASHLALRRWHASEQEQ